MKAGNQIVSYLATMHDFQKRVIAEKIELDTKLDALKRYIQCSHFNSLPLLEKERLTDQYKVMNEYSYILAERILAFIN